MIREVKNGKVAFKGGRCGRMDHDIDAFCFVKAELKFRQTLRERKQFSATGTLQSPAQSSGTLHRQISVFL